MLSGHPVLGGRVAQCVSNVSFHILSNATLYLADTSTDETDTREGSPGVLRSSL